MAEWIWLDEKRYPEAQTSYHTFFSEKEGYAFAVAEFFKEFTFEKQIEKAEITVSGDARFHLYANGEFLVTGPHCPGGDYDYKEPAVHHYANVVTFVPQENRLFLFANVQLLPLVQTEVSKGHGGFYLRCEVYFADGTTETLGTDDTWLCRKNESYVDFQTTDFRIPSKEFAPAAVVSDIWQVKKTEIPNLHEEFVAPREENSFTVLPKETKTLIFDFDRIYAGYTTFLAETGGDIEIVITSYEMPETVLWEETVWAKESFLFRAFRLTSVGGLKLTVKNQGEAKATFKHIGLISTHYPVDTEGDFVCSDELLNTIYNVGKHTLKICRQSIHLDSPKHQENLGCTGDYFIESLISYFTFGDPKLTRFDIIRTANLFQKRGGFMFHTSYSLIWVQMLYDYYQFTGDKQLLDCMQTPLHTLLAFMKNAEDEQGLLDTPPSFMFIDWVPVGSHNLHHPPKALGQTALCAFYYKALVLAEGICEILGDKTHKLEYETRHKTLKLSFQKAFWDSEKGLFVSGLTTPTPAHMVNTFLPQNIDTVHFGKHANTLAVLYDLAPEGFNAPIMKWVLEGLTNDDVQLYFMHFVLEALSKAELFEAHGLNQIRRWKAQTEMSLKGMKEMWGDFPGYHYDFSHAWGATPTYQLPAKLSGLQMIKPGFEKISLSPNLMGLAYADITIPTPFGEIKIRLKENEEPEIFVPKEIECEIL